MYSCLPFFYHPTTVLYLDDGSHADQVKVLSLKCPIKFISGLNKQEFVQMIKQNVALQASTHRHFEYLEEEELETYRVSVNLQDIYKVIYSESRFDRISTVIVDHNAVGNSFEFLGNIQQAPVKKILLINDSDQSLAIEAFNLGLIDACISKQQNNFDKVLQETVEKCQESYFVALSKYVEVFFSPMDRKKSALYSEEFRSYFKNIIKTHNIKEFYLLERQGSFLCLDEQGNHGVLATQSQETLESFLESQEAITADPIILKTLKEGSHILCYKNLTETFLPIGSRWVDYVFKADCFKENDETFLCAYVLGQFGLRKEHLKTFQPSNNE